MTTAAELKKAARAHQLAAAKATKARLKRDLLICDALLAGWTHQRIADATGLTRGRINQISANCPTTSRTWPNVPKENET